MTSESGGNKVTMSIEERKHYYDDSLRNYVHYAYQNSPAMKAKLDNAGVSPSDLRATGDLEKLPITRKDDFIEAQRVSPPFGGYLAVPPGEIEKIGIQPGPLYLPFRPQDHIPAAELFRTAGVKKGDVFLNPLSYTFMAAITLDAICRELGVTILPTGPGNTDIQVRTIYEVKPTVLFAFTGFLLAIIEKAEQIGYNFTSDFAFLRTVLLGGEMAPPAVRRRIEEDYRLDSREIYGTGELGHLAFECERKAGMHFLDEAVIEIVDPLTGKQIESGQAGELVLTPIFNRTYPLVRWGTGDLAVCTTEPCECGRTSPRLLRIAGRVGEAARIKGTWLIPKHVNEVLSKVPEIAGFQVLVANPKGKDEITYRIELKGRDIDREAFLKYLQKYIPDNLRLRADSIEFIDSGTIPEDRKIIEDKRSWD